MKYLTLLITSLLINLTIKTQIEPKTTELKQKIQYHNTQQNSLQNEKAHNELNNQIENLKQKAEANARTKLYIHERSGNDAASPLKDKKNVAPYPLLSQQKNNSPTSSNASPWALTFEHKDNSPTGTASTYEVKIKTLDKRWLVKDATTGLAEPANGHMNYSATIHTDNSPPKVQGEAEHAGPADGKMEFKHADTSPPKVYGQTEVSVPFEAKQEVPYSFQKSSGGIVAGVSIGINDQQFADKKNIKDKNAILNARKANSAQMATDDKKACGCADAPGPAQPCVGTPQPCTTQKQGNTNTNDNTGQEQPQNVNIVHKDNSPPGATDKPYNAQKRSELPELNANVLDSLSDINAVKDQYQVMRIQYNSARDQLSDLKERLENSKKQSSKHIAELQLANEVAEERKRKLAEEFEFLNNKFVAAEAKNTELKTENMKLQSSLKEASAHLSAVESETKNKRATLDTNEAELQRLKSTQSKLLHDKLEIEAKLDSEVSDRKRWEEKNGVLKMQLDQEIAVNELLKSKLASGLTQSDAKQIIKEQLLNDQNNVSTKETNQVNKNQNDSQEIKKSVISSQDNIESNNAESNKFQNEEQVENQTKSNSRLKSKKGSDDMKISLTQSKNDDKNQQQKKKDDKKDSVQAEQVNSPYSSLIVNDTNSKDNKINFNESKRDVNYIKENKKFNPAESPQNI